MATRSHVNSASAAAMRASPYFPPLPPPITFERVTLGGSEWLTTRLVHAPSATDEAHTAPVFYSEEQINGLLDYINTAPSVTSPLLVIAGAATSGKRALLRRVLPGLIAAQYATPSWHPRKQPVIVSYGFFGWVDPEVAVSIFAGWLSREAKNMHVPFATPHATMAKLPRKVRAFAKAVADQGGELWLLLEELQAAAFTTPSEAEAFTSLINQIVKECSPYARIVVTCSGLLGLVDCFRSARTGSYALWDGVSLVSLGAEPPKEAAVAMAADILKTFAASWPPQLRAAVKPQALVEALAYGTNEGLTSARPAVLARALAYRWGTRDGSPDEMFNTRVKKVACDLESEDRYAIRQHLHGLTYAERRLLLAVAQGSYTHAALRSMAPLSPSLKNLHRLIRCLCEPGTDGEAARLQPPYATLLQSWLNSDGTLAGSERLEMDHITRYNISGVWTCRPLIEKSGLWGAASAAFWASLISNRIGFVEEPGGRVRPPASEAEFRQVPAFMALVKVLHVPGNNNYAERLLRFLKKPKEGVPFEEGLGRQLICALWEFHAHVYRDTDLPAQAGLTTEVVAQAVRAVALALADPKTGCLSFDPKKPELLAERRAD